LAVLSSDALSSVAYATDAMLEVLAPVGLLAIVYLKPLTLLIAALLIVVVLSYRQTVTKFREGAWVVVILIPAGVWGLLTVSRHYSTRPS